MTRYNQQSTGSLVAFEMGMVEAKRDRPISYDCIEIDHTNLLAYDRLAHEYDDFSHLNTRRLENASIRGFEKLRDYFIPFRNSLILEIGCGTGVLTQNILRELNINSLDAIDISERMIEVSKKKINGAHYQVFSILKPPEGFLKPRYSLVFCGLADPYLVERAFRNISEIMVKEGLVFFSLPEKNFALREWWRRSGTPENRIRFKLKDNSSVISYSFTYELDALRRYLSEHRLQIKESLTLDSSIERFPKNHVFSEGVDVNLPRVLCVLAQKM